MAAVAAAGAWCTPGVRAPGTAEAADEALAARPRFLIVNADDFGMSEPINRGIVETHAHGIVTSTSLLVTGAAAQAASEIARDHPALSVGLHVDMSGVRLAGGTLDDLRLVSVELERQLALFQRLMGRLPTHVDSHHHVHLRFNVARVFLEMSERYGLPLRGLSPVVYIGGFYGQWPPGRSAISRISPAALIALLDELGPGLYALGCHPGYSEPNAVDVYRHEREVELRSLTDPRVRDQIDRRAISLVSYHQYPRLASMARIGAIGRSESR